MRNVTLVIVPGTGARQIEIENGLTVAQLVCQHNLHGRDIIVNGVGVAPQAWEVTTLDHAVEVFATGSVKGNLERAATLVVVPGTGARSVTIQDTMTVADFVCRENLHGRDIIINGVGVSPQQWQTQTLQGAVEIFATGSVKGNVSRTATLVVVPGTGARSVQFESDMTVADFVCRENLHGRDIILNGVGVPAQSWNQTRLNDTVEIFATGSVKGNGAESFIEVAYGTDAKRCFDDLVKQAFYEHGHNPYNGTISTVSGFKVEPASFQSKRQALDYADDKIEDLEKRQCRAVSFVEDDKKGFVFYGWAAC